MEVDTPRVSIVILNWNGWKDTIECLESLYRIQYPNYDVIVIDNGSMDGSVESILKYAEGDLAVDSKFFKFSTDSKPIKTWKCTKDDADQGNKPGENIIALPSNKRMIIIENDKNYGFAEGCNIGIRYAFAVLEPEYVLLLNNDTVVKNDFLDELVKGFSCDNKAGFAGPIVYYYDYDGRTDIISTAGAEITMCKGSINLIGHGDADQGQYNTIRAVDYIEGSCLFIKSAVLEKIGLLDPSYFVYWEETDLCTRGLEVGYTCMCVPTAKIWHKISASLSLASRTYVYYTTRNRLWFMRTHATREELYSFLAYFFIRQFPVNIGVYLCHKDSERLSAFLQGVLHGLFSKKGGSYTYPGQVR